MLEVHDRVYGAGKPPSWWRRIREELQQRDLASEMRVLALEERLAALEAMAPSYL